MDGKDNEVTAVVSMGSELAATARQPLGTRADSDSDWLVRDDVAPRKFSSTKQTCGIASIMAGKHYDITASELENHPDLPILRHPDTLSLYYATKLLERRFLCSTSSWSGVHLRALKVLQFVDLPLDRICPSTYIVDETSEVAQIVRTTLSLPPREVMARRYSQRSLEAQFYNQLAVLLRTTQHSPSPRSNQNAIIARRRSTATTSLAVPQLTTSLAVSPPDQEGDTILGMSFRSEDSGSSYYPSQTSPQSPRNDSSDAPASTALLQVREIVTNSLIIAFLEVVSSIIYPEYNPVKPKPEFNVSPDHIKLVLMGSALTSENDGSGWKMRWSKSGGQYVSTGGAPLVTVEVRSRFL
jgi:hypothetical protein